MDEEDKNWGEYINSQEFKDSFRKQVEKDTWGQGLPMIYTDKNGDMVKHFKDGTIEIIKYATKNKRIPKV